MLHNLYECGAVLHVLKFSCCAVSAVLTFDQHPGFPVTYTIHFLNSGIGTRGSLLMQVNIVRMLRCTRTLKLTCFTTTVVRFVRAVVRCSFACVISCTTWDCSADAFCCTLATTVAAGSRICTGNKVTSLTSTVAVESVHAYLHK